MLGFYDPINRVHLMYPTKMQAELPLDADLTYIRRAVKSGRLVDVSGTVTGQVRQQDTPPQEPSGAAATETTVEQVAEVRETQPVAGEEDAPPEEREEEPKEVPRKKR